MEKKPVTYKYTAKYECFCNPCYDHEDGCRGGELVGEGTGFFTETDAKRAAYTFFKCSERYIEEALTYRVFRVGPRGGEKMIDTRRNDMSWWDNIHLSAFEKLVDDCVYHLRKVYIRTMETNQLSAKAMKQGLKIWSQADYDEEGAQLIETYGSYEDIDWDDIVTEWCKDWPKSSGWLRPSADELSAGLYRMLRSRREADVLRLHGG